MTLGTAKVASKRSTELYGSSVCPDDTDQLASPAPPAMGRCTELARLSQGHGCGCGQGSAVG